MTKDQQQKALFEKIERGVQVGALKVIKTAKDTKTKIVVADKKGKIKELSPAQAQRALNKREAESIAKEEK